MRLDISCPVERERKSLNYNLLRNLILIGNGNSANLTSQSPGIYYIKIQQGSLKVVKQ